jgi:hypothetical protein
MNLLKQVITTNGVVLQPEGSVGIAATTENVSTSATALVLSPVIESSYVTSTGAHTATLADGKVDGQKKKIALVVDGGNLTVTVASLVGGNTLTFADAGDLVVLEWVQSLDTGGGLWMIIVNTGAVALSTV